MSNRVGLERSSIVAANLIDTCSERSRAVEIANDDVGVCRETALEVRTDRCDEDEEHILCSRVYAHLSACADKERTDVESGSALVGRNVLLVQTHHLLYHLLKQLCGYLRHEDAATSALQTCCVLVHAEHAHLAVGTTVSFQTFKGLLSVVETGSCHVEFDVFVGANLYFAPFAVAIAATHIVVGRHVAERQIRPI